MKGIFDLFSYISGSFVVSFLVAWNVLRTVILGGRGMYIVKYDYMPHKIIFYFDDPDIIPSLQNGLYIEGIKVYDNFGWGRIDLSKGVFGYTYASDIKGAEKIGAFEEIEEIEEIED